MKIREILIEHFKRFERLEVKLSDFDCLVGSNNVGKSTVLQALSVFDYCAHRCLERRNGNITIQSHTDSPDEFVAIQFADPTALWTDGYWRRGNTVVPLRVSAVFDNEIKATVSIKHNMNRLGISLDVRPENQQSLLELAGFSSAYLPVFSSLAPREERRTPAVIADELSRGRIHGVVRNLLFDLKKRGRHEILGKILQSTFPDIHDLSIEFDELTDRYVSVSYREADRRKDLDLFSQGSGFQQLVYLFGYLLQAEPSVALLDEPDVHLHGQLQEALVEQLRMMSDQGTQILLATHSRDIIERLSPRDILYLDEKGTHRLEADEQVFDTLESLGSLGPADVPRLQRFGKLLLVENKSDFKFISIFFNKCLSRRRWNRAAQRIAVGYTLGNPRNKDIRWLRQQIQNHLGRSERSLEVFVIGDRDYYPGDPGELAKELSGDHIEWHVWQRAEIENYLLVETAFERLVVEKRDSQLSLDTASMRSSFRSAVEQSKNNAQDRLVKAYEEYGRHKKKGWDTISVSRLAREHVAERWEDEWIELADAKDVVLPEMHRRLRASRGGSVSNLSLARLLEQEELPEEMRRVAERVAAFAGIEEIGEFGE